MPAFTLQNLAERSIAIDVIINGQQLRLRGRGELTEMTGIGPVLKIHIPDPAGEFDVILSQDRFKGPIVEDKESGCDFSHLLAAVGFGDDALGDWCAQPALRQSI